jgi:hypothetical protein
MRVELYVLVPLTKVPAAATALEALNGNGARQDRIQPASAVRDADITPAAVRTPWLSFPHGRLLILPVRNRWLFRVYLHAVSSVILGSMLARLLYTQLSNPVLLLYQFTIIRA